jgi:CDP-glucose 4,6-dehydratase
VEGLGLMLSFYRGKRILVTGHTGFKGSWLCRALVMAGADVTGYALEPPTNPGIFQIIGLKDEMNSVIGDIRDLDHLKKVFLETKPELVLHMAAQPIVRTSYEEPVYTYETNVLGTVNVMECVRLTDSVNSFLNVTTDKVYDNRELGKPFVETEQLDGFDPYSNSKSCSELVTHSYRRSFFADGRCAISTARAGNVIGGGDFAKDRIIPDCVKAAASEKPVIIRNPDSVRPFQLVLEPLKVYLMILEKQLEDRKYEGAYNVGPDMEDCITTGALVKLFQKHWGDDFQWEVKPDGGPHEAGFLKLDCTKLKSTFGWKPEYHIDEAVKKTVEWSKAYLAGEEMTDITDKQIKEFF